MANSNSNPNDFQPPIPALRLLCIDHLRHEAEMLTAALVVVRAMDAAFRQHSAGGFALMISRHAEVAALIDTLHSQRARFRESAARAIRMPSDKVTIAAVLARLPARDRDVVTAELARVRDLAEELTTLNHRVAICLRIHLDAYQRILRDLTNSRQGSGRYGPTGNAESHGYQPIIQLHG